MANERSAGNARLHDEPDREALPREIPGQEISDTDPRQLLIDRISSSAAFRRASRLRELLHYLAGAAIRGRACDLSEQKIGEAVFAKAAGYSPAEDSSVRVHIRQLRLKLHEYFDSEGRNEPLIIEVPKGSYALVFHAIPVPLPAPAASPPPPPSVNKAPRLGSLLPWIVAAALGAFSVVLWIETRPPARPPTPWPLSAVFNGADRSQIVLADATYGIRRLISGKPASLEEYVKRDFQQLELPHANAPAEYLARYSADALLTSWADVAVATTFIKLFPGRPEQVAVRSARDLRFRDLKEGNYVFLGSPASNPWVLLFEDRLNFYEVRGDEIRGEVKYFANRNPRAGEHVSYAGLSRTGADGEDYAAIALLPADGKRGNVLIVQGLQQEGTEAAGLFLTDEGGRSKLRKSLGLQGEPAKPLYFETLLRIKAVAGSPGSVDVVASRVIQP